MPKETGKDIEVAVPYARGHAVIVFKKGVSFLYLKPKFDGVSDERCSESDVGMSRLDYRSNVVWIRSEVVRCGLGVVLSLAVHRKETGPRHIGA